VDIVSWRKCIVYTEQSAFSLCLSGWLVLKHQGKTRESEQEQPLHLRAYHSEPATLGDFTRPSSTEALHAAHFSFPRLVLRFLTCIMFPERWGPSPGPPSSSWGPSPGPPSSSWPRSWGPPRSPGSPFGLFYYETVPRVKLYHTSPSFSEPTSFSRLPAATWLSSCLCRPSLHSTGPLVSRLLMPTASLFDVALLADNIGAGG